MADAEMGQVLYFERSRRNSFALWIDHVAHKLKTHKTKDFRALSV